MAKRAAAGEVLPPAAGVLCGTALRAFQVSYGPAFLTIQEGASVPADTEFRAFADKHHLPVEWSFR